MIPKVLDSSFTEKNKDHDEGLEKMEKKFEMFSFEIEKLTQLFGLLNNKSYRSYFIFVLIHIMAFTFK